MGQRYLIDSNVIIDYASLRLPQSSSDFVEHIFNTDFQISFIVKIEVLGFDDVPDKMQAMEEFINLSIVLPLDEIVVQQTIQLRRQYKKLKLPDAIIAATALVHDLVLLTRNTSDFMSIQTLKVTDPYSVR